jgi:hypothetical protein
MNEVYSQYHPSFQPNRFKQCPRFSIFHSKNRETENHLKENIISLNYGVMNLVGYTDQASSIRNESSRSPLPKAGEDALEFNVRVEDPFDKVLLLKNIDNAILTSFRTLREENNTISETMKVVHNKF